MLKEILPEDYDCYTGDAGLIAMSLLYELKKESNEFRKYIETDKALEQRVTVSILRGLKPRYELHQGMKKDN